MSGLFPEGTFSVVFKMMLTDCVETRLQVVGESEKLNGICAYRQDSGLKHSRSAFSYYP